MYEFKMSLLPRTTLHSDSEHLQVMPILPKQQRLSVKSARLVSVYIEMRRKMRIFRLTRQKEHVKTLQ
jgi:hypothetical protein